MDAIMDAHAELYERATVTHPFLVGCADGSVSDAAFNTWLVQDYLYVQSFQRFAAALTIKSEHSSLYLGAETTIAEELVWFESMATARGLQVVPSHFDLLSAEE
jgi:thiaminase